MCRVIPGHLVRGSQYHAHRKDRCGHRGIGPRARRRLRCRGVCARSAPPDAASNERMPLSASLSVEK
eukprot:2097196-Rhodomonas_salina.3